MLDTLSSYHMFCPEPTQLRIGHSPLPTSTGGRIFGPNPTSGQVTPDYLALTAETMLPNCLATLCQGAEEIGKDGPFLSTIPSVIELSQATAANPTSPPPASLLRHDVSLMSLFTVLLAFYLTTNTCNLTSTIPTLLYRPTEDKFHMELVESWDDASNGRTVSINNVANPDIPSICYVGLRSNLFGNLVYCMRHVKSHLPDNMSYPTSIMSLPPARQWERVVENFITRLLATHVFGRFSNFPKKAKTAKCGPLIVTHFFPVWPFVAKFLEANCSVERRQKFVTTVLDGSAGTVIRDLARGFKVTGPPSDYPIHMEGDMVLKLDLSSTPGLTPAERRRRKRRRGTLRQSTSDRCGGGVRALC